MYDDVMPQYFACTEIVLVFQLTVKVDQPAIDDIELEIKFYILLILNLRTFKIISFVC